MVEADFSVYEFRKEQIGLRMKQGLFASETLSENLTTKGLGKWHGNYYSMERKDEENQNRNLTYTPS